MRILTNVLKVLASLIAMAALMYLIPTFVGAKTFMNNKGIKPLEKIENACGLTPEKCVSGSLVASMYGTTYGYQELEGVVVNRTVFGEVGDGFMLFDAGTGEFLVNIVYPYCSDQPDCEGEDDRWVKGYRPVSEGEHVTVQIYRLYGWTCPASECGSVVMLVKVTKLPDIPYAEPVIPMRDITITVDGVEMGEVSSLDEAIDEVIVPAIEERVAENCVKMLTRVPEGTGGNAFPVDLYDRCRQFVSEEEFAEGMANQVNRSEGKLTVFTSSKPFVIRFKMNVYEAVEGKALTSSGEEPLYSLVFDPMSGLTAIEYMDCGSEKPVIYGTLVIDTCEEKG